MLLYLKELLKAKGVTSIELSERVGVTKPMVSYWVSGKSFPAPDKLVSIAEALDVPVWQLFRSPNERDCTGGVFCPHCGEPLQVVLVDCKK